MCSESPQGSNNPPAQVSADPRQEFRAGRFFLTVKLGLKPGLEMTRDEAIAEITHKLVEFYQPIRIYLFGSVARGDDGPDSDLDFLVVVPDDSPDDKLRPGAGRRAVRGTGFAKDIVPWRKTDFEQRAAWVKASLPATVMREGRLLYDAR